MRDASCAYWFQVGDRVQVVEDVYKSGVNLKDQVGIVIETWEKCDVDPTCCCAEQVDLGMAVHVKFIVNGTLSNSNNNNNIDLEMGDKCEMEQFFVHYFAEDELIAVKEERENV